MYKRDNLCKSGCCWIHTGAHRGNEEGTPRCRALQPTAELWKSDTHKLSTKERDFPDIDDRNSNSTLIKASVITSLPMNTPYREGEGTGSVCEPLNSPWWGLNRDKKNMNCKTEICKSTFQWYKIVNTTKFLQFFLFSVHWNRWLSFCIKTARDQTEAVRYRY